MNIGMVESEQMLSQPRFSTCRQLKCAKKHCHPRIIIFLLITIGARESPLNRANNKTIPHLLQLTTTWNYTRNDREKLMLSALAILWPFPLNKSCNVLFLYCNQLSKASKILKQQVFSVCQREEMLFKSSKECQTMQQLLLNWTLNFYFSQIRARILCQLQYFASHYILCFIRKVDTEREIVSPASI